MASRPFIAEIIKQRASNLERAPADPQARLFLAFTRAATGECDAAIPDLAKGFSSGENRRLAGIALAQCHIAAKALRRSGRDYRAARKRIS